MKRSCVVMCSGGLDSLLALAAMARQGVRTIAFHGVSVFHDKGDSQEHLDHLREQFTHLGADEVIFRDQTEAMVQLTCAPRFGYGKHLNACIDCRILTLGTARAVQVDTGADFVASGEVVGQRPMSQRRDAMRTVEREAERLGLKGILLRPLCAKLLEPTIPETEGWVDRQQLFDFQGRTRKPQMALAEAWGIEDYPTPAGGCLLTDEVFSIRLRDVMEHTPDWGADDVRLLRVGRHYRLPAGGKLVVSRNQAEGERLKELAREGDRFRMNDEKPGALALVRGPLDNEGERVACGLAVHYSKSRDDGRARVRGWTAGEETEPETRSWERVDPETVQALHVGVR